MSKSETYYIVDHDEIGSNNPILYADEIEVGPEVTDLIEIAEQYARESECYEWDDEESRLYMIFAPNKEFLANVRVTMRIKFALVSTVE